MNRQEKVGIKRAGYSETLIQYEEAVIASSESHSNAPFAHEFVTQCRGEAEHDVLFAQSTGAGPRVVSTVASVDHDERTGNVLWPEHGGQVGPLAGSRQLEAHHVVPTQNGHRKCKAHCVETCEEQDRRKKDQPECSTQ